MTTTDDGRIASSPIDSVLAGSNLTQLERSVVGRDVQARRPFLSTRLQLTIVRRTWIRRIVGTGRRHNRARGVRWQGFVSGHDDGAQIGTGLPLG